MRAARFDLDKAEELVKEVAFGLTIREAEREIERAKESLRIAEQVLKDQDDKLYPGFGTKWRPKHARHG